MSDFCADSECEHARADHNGFENWCNAYKCPCMGFRELEPEEEEPERPPCKNCGHPGKQHFGGSCLVDVDTKMPNINGFCPCYNYQPVSETPVAESKPEAPNLLNCAACGHSPQDHQFITDSKVSCVYGARHANNQIYQGCGCSRFEVNHG